MFYFNIIKKIKNSINYSNIKAYICFLVVHSGQYIYITMDQLKPFKI